MLNEIKESVAVDLNNADPQDIFLVPLGKEFYYQSHILRRISVDLSAEGTTQNLYLKESGAGRMLAESPINGLFDEERYRTLRAPITCFRVDAGNKVQFQVDAAYGQPAMAILDLF